MSKVKAYYRSLFISDTHMGWSRSNCGDAALLLDHVKCDKLYLNGDIFDGWKLKKRWFWAEDHDYFLSAVLRKIDEGTKVFLIPGNHDEDLRDTSKQELIKKIAQKYNFTFTEKIEHKTHQGQNMLVMHGDQFDDGFTRSISETADKIYNGSLEKILGMGRPKKVSKENGFSLSTYFRNLAKGGGTSLKHSNETYINHVIEKLGISKHHGVIIGHTHAPTIEKHKFTDDQKTKNKTLKDHFLYANSGDWVLNHTALVEHSSGKLELLSASDVLKHRYFEDYKYLKTSKQLKFHPKTANLRRWLHALWSPTPLNHDPSATGTSKKQRKSRFKKIFGL